MMTVRHERGDGGPLYRGGVSPGGPRPTARRGTAWRVLFAVALVVAFGDRVTNAQTTSLSKRLPPEEVKEDPGREDTEYPGNPTLEQHSLFAVKIQPPRKHRIHDLVTVIVRQQTKYESDGSVDSKKEAEIESKIDSFLNFIDGGLGAAAFRRGKPNIEYSLETELKNKAKKDREDRLTARVTAEIIDVKPNGNLVLEARSRQVFEDEIAVMTLTGTCRSIDVTAGNTVLSTQLADLNLRVKNSGAVHDGSSRGWLQKILDKTKPF
ncbi:MAG: flagellar basal body L-ring protein FlgH [bacterium]|nr:flagellar basal body L-ring protein FlgH [bacterium]